MESRPQYNFLPTKAEEQRGQQSGTRLPDVQTRAMYPVRKQLTQSDVQNGVISLPMDGVMTHIIKYCRNGTPLVINQGIRIIIEDSDTNKKHSTQLVNLRDDGYTLTNVRTLMQERGLGAGNTIGLMWQDSNCVSFKVFQ